jgi:fructose-bisphosphate aldolase class I
MRDTALALIAPGKGILAADESFGTIERRFHAVGVESTEERRRAYREMLFRTAGVSEFISGVILFDETIHQSTTDNTPFPEFLRQQGIIPGIKVDTGTKPMAGHPGETITEGLDGLRARLAKYEDLGARFAKWRATISIGDGMPTLANIGANAHALGRYAALCQEAKLVPIVEPEVLMDGNHAIGRCFRTTLDTLNTVYAALREQGVALAETLLKPNMVVPGKSSGQQLSLDEVAEATLSCLYDAVPAAVPGIVFLSGGQSDVEATARLDAMNRLGPHPWELSFSYGRALQASSLIVWAGDDRNYDAGQAAFLHRARLNSAARSGSYEPAMELAVPS